ncbi:unnamed protein product [Heterobilharzia americana]|nr:unnamed protein product [Heterobilharzia americana]
MNQTSEAVATATATAFINLPFRISITSVSLLATIFNVTAIIVVFNSYFGSKFTNFILKAQPIIDLTASLSAAIFYIVQSTPYPNEQTGVYIIDLLICHFWFRNASFWFPCILSVQNLVCISIDRFTSVVFPIVYKTNSNRLFVFYFLYLTTMLLILYPPTPLFRRYTEYQCVMDYSFPWMQDKIFLDFAVYSWVVFAYTLPVLVMIISHVWVIHSIRRSQSHRHTSVSLSSDGCVQIRKKVKQLVVTTAIMSSQQAALHFFECLQQILVTTGVMSYTYGNPIEQTSTLLLLFSCLLNPCILVLTTATLRRRLSISVKRITDKVSVSSGRVGMTSGPISSGQLTTVDCDR